LIRAGFARIRGISRSDADLKHQTQGWARTAQVAKPAKIPPGRNALRSISGRNAAFGRRRDQLRQKVMLALKHQQD